MKIFKKQKIDDYNLYLNNRSDLEWRLYLKSEFNIRNNY